MGLDQKDRRILAELLRDSSRAQKAMSSQLGMTDSDFTKHKSQLMQSGVIKGYTIDVDYKSVGLHTSGYFFFSEIDKSDEAADDITSLISGIPEITEASRVFGKDFDFIVKVVCGNTEDFYRVIQRIRAHEAIDGPGSYSVIVAVSIKDEPGSPISKSPAFLEKDPI